MADYEPRLKTHYRETVCQDLREEFGFRNDMQIPKLEKVVLNMGVGEAVKESRKIKSAVEEMAVIAGQQPVVMRARKVSRELSGSRRYDRGRQGHPSREQDVRVP